MATASETTGAWETVTVVPPFHCSRLAHRLLSFDANGQKKEATAPVTASGHENSEGDRVTASGHGNLPDEQGIANTLAVIDSDPKERDRSCREW